MEAASSRPRPELGLDGRVKDPTAFLIGKLNDAKVMLGGDVMAIPRDADVSIGQSSLAFRNLSFSIKGQDGRGVLELVSRHSSTRFLSRAVT